MLMQTWETIAFHLGIVGFFYALSEIYYWMTDISRRPPTKEQFLLILQYVRNTHMWATSMFLNYITSPVGDLANSIWESVSSFFNQVIDESRNGEYLKGRSGQHAGTIQNYGIAGVPNSLLEESARMKLEPVPSTSWALIPIYANPIPFRNKAHSQLPFPVYPRTLSGSSRVSCAGSDASEANVIIVTGTSGQTVRSAPSTFCYCRSGRREVPPLDPIDSRNDKLNRWTRSLKNPSTYDKSFSDGEEQDYVVVEERSDPTSWKATGWSGDCNQPQPPIPLQAATVPEKIPFPEVKPVVADLPMEMSAAPKRRKKLLLGLIPPEDLRLDHKEPKTIAYATRLSHGSGENNRLFHESREPSRTGYCNSNPRRRADWPKGRIQSQYVNRWNEV